MTQEFHPAAQLFSQLDAAPNSPATHSAGSLSGAEQSQLLRDILSAQDRQNELLEELIGHLTASQRQRQTELGQWKQANPRLARNCRMAADVLGRVQTEFLDTMTAEINSNAENLVDGEYVLNEFVDRFGPRLAHLNGVLQVLSQLSTVPNPASHS